MACPVCAAVALQPFCTVDSYEYYECGACGSLTIDPRVIDQIDAGHPIRQYDEAYWTEETKSARERSFGPALSRVAETLLYARLPVTKFLDIGTGPGFLLDALSTYLPDSRDVFWGVEAFPPAEHTAHRNYKVGSLSDLPGTFQAGVCIEVIEHLTPVMLRELITALASKSEQNSIYLFNTGLPAFVKAGNMGYLDPIRLGHLISWGLPGLAKLFAERGFELIALPGKSWAFLIEYRPMPSTMPIEDRIWHALPVNKAILNDSVMGGHMYVVGIDTARAYR